LSSSLDGWNELSNDSVFREDNGIEVLEGLGMSDFKIQLNNIDSNIKYLRFYVDVEEFYGEDGSGSSGKTNTGRSDVIVRVNNSSADGGIDLYVGSTLICNTSVGACEVLNNQVVTAKISGGDARNFLWSLNGKQINYLPAGETKQGDEVKFLVQGDLGSTFVLNVIANDTESVSATGPKNTGEKLNLTRNLVIVQSMIGLGPNNELNRTKNAVCGTLNGGSAVNASVGTYSTNSVAIDGSIQIETLSDCRETYYDANGIVDVPVTYYPSFIEADGATAKYYVNGVEQADGHIDLSGFEIGSLVTVTVKAQYSPVKSVGDLAKDWGVTQLQSSTPETMTDTIYIKVTDPDMGVKKSSKIIAGLAYNLPTQMIFIFRIMLTAMVIVFTSGVLMSLTKKRYNN